MPLLQNQDEFYNNGQKVNAMKRPDPRCFKCNRKADYFLHGIWVCLKCYPWDWASKAKKLKKNLHVRKVIQ